MPSSLARLDAVCVAAIVNDVPMTFGFGGVDYTGTALGWEARRELVPGGYHEDVEKKIVVAISAFGTDTPPAPNQNITVCVDGNGIPCVADEAVGDRKTVKIKHIARSGGAYTYTVNTATRG